MAPERVHAVRAPVDRVTGAPPGLGDIHGVFGLRFDAAAPDVVLPAAPVPVRAAGRTLRARCIELYVVCGCVLRAPAPARQALLRGEELGIGGRPVRWVAVSDGTRLTGEILPGDVAAGAAGQMLLTQLDTASLSVALSREDDRFPPAARELARLIVHPRLGCLLDTPEAAATLRATGTTGLHHRALVGFAAACAVQEGVPVKRAAALLRGGGGAEGDEDEAVEPSVAAARRGGGRGGGPAGRARA